MSFIPSSAQVNAGANSVSSTVSAIRSTSRSTDQSKSGCFSHRNIDSSLLPAPPQDAWEYCQVQKQRDQGRLRDWHSQGADSSAQLDLDSVQSLRIKLTRVRCQDLTKAAFDLCGVTVAALAVLGSALAALSLVIRF